jgi:hypothetical protein
MARGIVGFGSVGHDAHFTVRGRPATMKST